MQSYIFFNRRVLGCILGLIIRFEYCLGQISPSSNRDLSCPLHKILLQVHFLTVDFECVHWHIKPQFWILNRKLSVFQIIQVNGCLLFRSYVYVTFLKKANFEKKINSECLISNPDWWDWKKRSLGVDTFFLGNI